MLTFNQLNEQIELLKQINNQFVGLGARLQVIEEKLDSISISPEAEDELIKATKGKKIFTGKIKKVK